MIYVVNKRTKEHKALPDYFSQDASFYLESGVRWDIIRADADGWVPWSGESMEGPIPKDSLFDIKLRDGTASLKIRAAWWGQSGEDDDVIAYRPILDTNPSEPEAPEWAIGDRCTWHLGDVCMGEHVILAKDGDTYWIRDDHGGYDMADREELRPIRSEEDRLVEQALKDISAEPDEYGADSVVYRMIKAGYRKTGGDA